MPYERFAKGRGAAGSEVCRVRTKRHPCLARVRSPPPRSAPSFLQYFFDAEGEDKRDMFFCFFEYVFFLHHAQNDLRSAIVKEACLLLEKLSTAAGNSMAPLMRDMLNVLLQLMANGNSVRPSTM